MPTDPVRPKRESLAVSGTALTAASRRFYTHSAEEEIY